MPDDKAEAQAIQKQYYGDPEGLAVYLTQICICRAGLVFHVFQTFDAYSTFDVMCRFVTKINKSSLYRLASTKDGLILCKLSFIVLSNYRQAANLASALLPPSCGQTESTFQLLEHVIKYSATIADEYLEPRQLSSCEVDYYTNYNDSKDASKSGPKKPFKPEVCWQLPRQGAGFVVYNPDDLNEKQRPKYADRYGYDQIGTKETVDAMMHIAREWSALHPDRLLQYGDIARPGGINTPDHAEHNTGKAFDMRPVRKDGLLEALTYGQSSIYSLNLTKEFILLAVRLYPGTTVYFNDPQLHRIDAETRNIVDPSDLSHDNHLHVMFPGGKE